MKMEQTEYSGTSAYKIKTPGEITQKKAYDVTTLDPHYLFNGRLKVKFLFPP